MENFEVATEKVTEGSQTHVNTKFRDSLAAGLETACRATAGLTKINSRTAETHDQEKSTQTHSKIWNFWKIKIQIQKLQSTVWTVPLCM